MEKEIIELLSKKYGKSEKFAKLVFKIFKDNNICKEDGIEILDKIYKKCK